MDKKTYNKINKAIENGYLTCKRGNKYELDSICYCGKSKNPLLEYGLI